MARDIEEFLRRAAERRKQQKQGGAPKPPARQQQPRQQPPRQRQQPPRQPQRRQPPPVEAEIVDPVPASRRRQNPQSKKPKKKSLREQRVATHVRDSIDVSDVSARADTLGNRIADAHKKVGSTVSKHLDRDLPALDDTQSVTELPPPKIFGAESDEFVEELREMLRNPQMVGKAIILADILKRPEI